MLLIKKEAHKAPYIINPSDCTNLNNLPEQMDMYGNSNVMVMKITEDGLFALSLCLNASQVIDDNMVINCAFETCKVAEPYNILIAVTDVLFFRFKNYRKMNLFVEFQKLMTGSYEGEIFPQNYGDIFDLAPVTKDDARLIGAMLSDPRQEKYILTFINYTEELIKKDRENRERIKRFTKKGKRMIPYQEEGNEKEEAEHKERPIL